MFNPENPGYMRPRSGKSWQFIGKEFFTSPVRPYVDPRPATSDLRCRKRGRPCRSSRVDVPDPDTDTDSDPDPDLDETLKP